MELKKTLNVELLHFSEDQKVLLIDVVPLHAEISAEMIIVLLNDSPFHNLKPYTEGIIKATNAFNQCTENPQIHINNDAIIIAEQIDAKIIISLDPSEMFAEAQIIAAYGGKSATREQLQECLTQENISYGIQYAAIENLITSSATADPESCTKMVIAKGKNPVHGSNTYFKALVETPKERLFKPQELENGRVDMRNLGQLLTVIPGDALMQRIPHREGEDGSNVKGNNITHIVGKELKFKIGKNTALSATDENLLVATLAGIPKSLDNGMEVDDVLIIKRVDVNYGHVKYKGNVIIEGDICEGMQVSSTGDITVAGFVDSAHIICGGDLTIVQGLLGRQINHDSHQFSCNVQCSGTLTANFSQYSRIETGQDLNIKNQLLHCYVICAGHINVRNEKGNKGRVIGGYLTSKKSLCTTELGALAGSKTVIDLIGIYPQLIDSQKKLKEIQQQQQQQLQNIRLLQTKAKSAPASDKQKKMLNRIALTMLELNKNLHNLQQKILKNTDNLQLYFDQTQVIVKKKMFEDVIIYIGDKSFRSLRNYGPSKISVQNKVLNAEPYLSPK